MTESDEQLEYSSPSNFMQVARIYRLHSPVVVMSGQLLLSNTAENLRHHCWLGLVHYVITTVATFVMRVPLKLMAELAVPSVHE